MSFKENGFLGEEINAIASEIYKKYENLFHFHEELNRFYIETINIIKVEINDTRGLYIACLFLKILNNTQSISILSKLGLDSEAQIILRTSLETLFYLTALIKDEVFCNAYYQTQYYEDKRTLKKIEANSDSFPEYQTHPEKFVLNTPKDLMKEYKLFEIAEIAGLKEEYDIAYTWLCSSVHPSISNLEERYLIIKSNKLLGLCFSYSTEDIERTLSTCCYSALKAIEGINDYFKLNIEEKSEVLSNKYYSLFSN